MATDFSIQNILSREDYDGQWIMFNKDNPLVIPWDYVNNNKQKQRKVESIFQEATKKISNTWDKNKFIKTKEEERNELLKQLQTFAKDHIYECMLKCARELCKLRDRDSKLVTSFRAIRAAIVDNLFETKSYEDVISTFHSLFKITFEIFDRSKLWNQAILWKFMKMHNVQYKHYDWDNRHDSLSCYVSYVKSILVRNMMQAIKKSTGFYLSISSSEKRKRRKNQYSVHRL